MACNNIIKNTCIIILFSIYYDPLTKTLQLTAYSQTFQRLYLQKRY